MARMCSVFRIFQTNRKLFMCAKEKTRNKKRYFTWLTQNLVEQSSRNNLLNSRILKHANCINWELKFSMKSTMSSLNIYFKYYRNVKFYYRSLTLFSMGYFKNITVWGRGPYAPPPL